MAAAQITIDIDNPATTWAGAIDAVRRAAAGGAELVVLPELACAGSAFVSATEAATRAEAADGPTATRFGELAAELGLVIVVGFVERNPDGERPYNSLLLIDRGVVRACYRKTHLWDREKILFTAGSTAAPVVDTSLGRVAAMICYDLELPEMARDVALRGAQLIAVPANWPVVPKPATERPIEVVKTQAAASANHITVVVADRCGPERGVDFFGSSVICDVTGFPVAGPADGEPALLLADLDLSRSDDKRLGPYNDALADRRLDLSTP